MYLCRNEPMPGCAFTFHSVVQRMQELAKSQAAFLINPTVGVRTSSCAHHTVVHIICSLPHTAWGVFMSSLQITRELCVNTWSGDLLCVFLCVQPEAISGSSRMKGGSATKILLDVVLSSAHAAAFTKTPVTYK